MTRRQSLLLLAAVYTLCNAFKPLHIDDTAYYYVARQAADHPLDPYGFASFWWFHAEPANQVLAPPVLPTWWSVAVRLFGERPFLWKLWLFPFSLLFAGALAALFRRFARGLEMPLVWMTVLSPTFFPSLNLMLDVPALALSLTALALFLRACDSDSGALAALAGLVAGLALETKYTAFLTLVAMLLYALFFRRLRLWAVVVVVAVQIFVGWELFTALLYGESHFLHATRDSTNTLRQKLLVLPSLLPILGGVIGPVVLLALASLRASRRSVLAAGGVVAAAYALAALLGDRFREWWADLPICRQLTRLVEESFEFEYVLFGLFGVLAVAVGGLVARRLCRLPHAAERWRREDWFLLLWLGLELAGYSVLSPFAAVRRVMGIIIVATLLAGRLAARTCRTPERRWLVQGIAVYCGVLGLGFFLLDLREAWAIKDAAESGALLARHRASGNAWFIGHWGFQFYAERAGMHMVIPSSQPTAPSPMFGRAPIPLPGPSAIRAGDCLVWPDPGIPCYGINVPGDCIGIVGPLQWDDPVRLQTVICFYAGSSPLRHRSGPRRMILVVQVVQDFQP